MVGMVEGFVRRFVISSGFRYVAGFLVGGISFISFYRF